MSKSSRKKKTHKKQKKSLPWVISILGIALLASALGFALKKPAKPYTPEITGAPAIQADKQAVDLGDIRLGKWVNVTFQVTNVGDQPLRLTQKPYIEVKEGC
jgi:hypothetical protein